MAVLNKNATKLNEQDIQTKTQNEVAANAYTKAAKTTQSTGGTNGAYQAGKKVSEYIANSPYAAYNAEMLTRNAVKSRPDTILAELKTGITNVRNFFRGLGGELSPIDNSQNEKDLAKAYSDIMYAPTSFKASETDKSSTNETPSSSDNVSTSGTSLGTTTANTNPYSSYLNSEKSYQQQQLDNERNNAIQRAKQAYLKAVNPYGVQAEALASAGLAPNGGYGQRMQTANYNAYANAVNVANNQYQSDTAALDRQLAYQQYQTEQSEKQNAASNALNDVNLTNALLSGALSIGQSMANWGRKGTLENEAAIRQSIKQTYPNISDELISTVIAMMKET